MEIFYACNWFLLLVSKMNVTTFSYYNRNVFNNLKNNHFKTQTFTNGNQAIVLSKFSIPNNFKSNWDLLLGILPLLAWDYFLCQHLLMFVYMKMYLFNKVFFVNHNIHFMDVFNMRHPFLMMKRDPILANVSIKSLKDENFPPPKC